MIYEYKILDNKLKIITTCLCFAENEAELRSIVQTNNKILIGFKEKRISRFSKVLSPEKFTLPFFINIYTLISNNIELVKALEIALNAFHKTEHKAVIQYLIYKISGGMPLHLAMESLSELKIFDKITIKTMQIAGQTATLNEAFSYLIEYLGDGLKTKKALKSSMIYPLTLLVVMLSVTFFWIFFIIPTFVDSFSDMGMDVPSVTLGLLGFRSFILTHKLLIFFTIILSVIVSYKYKDQILSRVPIVKTIGRNLKMLRFFNSMGLMLQEKINFIEAIEFTIGLNKNKDFDASITEIISKIKQGNSISHAFNSTTLFTEQEIAIIKSGEQVGDIASVFQIIAKTLQSDTKNIINRLQSLIQPISTIIMGLMLLIIVCSIFLPMYDQLGTYI